MRSGESRRAISRNSRKRTHSRHPIVTKVEPFKGFYPAEFYHQNYLTQHPNSEYIALYDLPKVASLKRLFPHLYSDKPVLVQAAQ